MQVSSFVYSKRWIMICAVHFTTIIIGRLQMGCYRNMNEYLFIMAEIGITPHLGIIFYTPIDTRMIAMPISSA
jgi:hypothetical protein